MKRQYAKRCEFCEETLGPSRWCENCKKRVKGYVNDNPDKMPPKANKTARIELLKSMAALNRLKQNRKEPEKKEPKRFEITCMVCLRVVEVDGWKKRQTYPVCDDPACVEEKRRMMNNKSRRAMAWKREKRKYVKGSRGEPPRGRDSKS